MHLDNALHQCQPDSRALDALIQALEQSEDLLVISRVNPDTIIRHIERDIGSNGYCTDVNPRVRLITQEFDGVLHQILDYFHQSSPVAIYLG